MGNTKEHTRAVRERLEADGRYVVAASEARERVKREGDMDAPWRDHIRSQFRRDGWHVDDEVYYHPEKLSEKVREFSQNVKSEGRPVVSKGITSQQVAKMDYPSGEWGRIIDETMVDEGWQIRDQDGLYYVPPSDLVTENALSLYLMNAFEVPRS